MPVDVPARDQPPRPERATPSRFPWAVAAVALVVAAVAGYFLGKPDEKPAPPRADTGLSSSTTAGAINLRFPGSWERRGEAPKIPGLALEDQVAVGPGSSQGQGVIAGMSDATGPRLLPAAFVAGLSEPPRPADRVKLGKLEALRYEGLEADGFDGRALTVFAAPTGGGVATLACFAPPGGGAAFRADCERVAGSLAVDGETAYPVGADPAYGKDLTASSRRWTSGARPGAPRSPARAAPPASARPPPRSPMPTRSPGRPRRRRIRPRHRPGPCRDRQGPRRRRGRLPAAVEREAARGLPPGDEERAAGGGARRSAPGRPEGARVRGRRLALRFTCACGLLALASGHGRDATQPALRGRRRRRGSRRPAGLQRGADRTAARRPRRRLRRGRRRAPASTSAATGSSPTRCSMRRTARSRMRSSTPATADSPSPTPTATLPARCPRCWRAPPPRHRSRRGRTATSPPMRWRCTSPTTSAR